MINVALLLPLIGFNPTDSNPSDSNPLDSNLGFYRQPSLRGDQIAFVSHRDLWVVDTKGGLARSLTSHVAPASHPAISPDGKTLAFTGTYEGPSEVYVMPIEGGKPERLTFSGDMTVVGWTPEGKVEATTHSRSTLPGSHMVLIDPKTHQNSEVPLAEISEGDYDPETKDLYFTRQEFQGSKTKRYKGGLVQDLWRFGKGAQEAVPLTSSFTGTSKGPMFWQNRVYFLSDRDGTMNIWSMDTRGGSLAQVTHRVGWDIQSASLDSGKIAYQCGADIFLFDLATKVEQKVDIRLSSDFESVRERWVKDPSTYVSSAQISPNGGRVALTVRGQIFVAPVESGRVVEAARKPGVRYRNAFVSPDNKSIFALSDQTGETEWWKLPANGVGPNEQITSGTKVLGLSGAVSPNSKYLAYTDKNQELWVYDLTAKTAKKVETNDYDVPSGFRWSPDSRWLAYVSATSSFTKLKVYSVETDKTQELTSGRSDIASPSWSPDGKWLYFLSDRTFKSLVSGPWGPRQPEPFFDKQTKIYALGLVKGLRSPFEPADELVASPDPKAEAKPAKPVAVEAKSVTVDIDPEGISERLTEVPVPAGNYGNLYATADRLILNSSAAEGPANLVAVDIKDKDVSVVTLATGISDSQVSDDGKKILVRKEDNLYVIPSASGPGVPLDKAISLDSLSLSVPLREEWQQMYREAWRLERDYFWDKNLGFVDWERIYKKYLPLVDRVRDRQELSEVLGEMVGELSTLHMFVYGGDNRTPIDNVSLGFLGASLTRDTSVGGYRVEKVYRGEPDYPKSWSPLAKPTANVVPGDIILAVNGHDSLEGSDIQELLRNQAGKQVLLHIKEGATGTIRDCIVRPISAGEDFNLRYSDWEVSRRQLVDDKSSHQIGYVHLRAMGSGDIAQWQRDFYPVFDRPGLIIDVRHNNGGNIDSWIIEKMLRKAWFYWQPRLGKPYWNMQWAFRGHVVVLCDQHTASDGEAFTEGMKRLGLAKVIGKRTWGGEVWLSSDNGLVDNGIATAAEYGVFGPEGKWLIEGHGVDPDIEVDNLPHATYLGQDAQLDAALQYLSQQIKSSPVNPPTVPAYPNKKWPPK